MKPTSNLRIVFTVSSLLVILSITISLINYAVSLNSTQQDLKNRSLPLSIDNIYSEIQSNIIKPNLVSSMMSHDTFVKDWILNEEQNREKITHYLEAIKNKYGMFVTFLVSEKTRNYYTQNGFLETLKEDNPNNQWYYRFKDIPDDHEINLDFNDNFDNSLIMFINYKMFDADYRFIGTTGIGLKISYVDEMLRRFRQLFNFTVYFVNKEGKVVLSERREGSLKNLSDYPALLNLKDQIISKDSKILEYKKDGNDFLLNTKYIPELDLYLIVEARLSDFIENVHHTFYFNLAVSLMVTLVITLVILSTIRGYNRRLEFLAQNDTLTHLMNRRAFNERLEEFHLLSKRNKEPLSLLFFDMDNFKNINDTFGHHAGDQVLKRMAELLHAHLRQTDLIARWGGEEFIVGLINTDIDDARSIGEKLRHALEEDLQLKQLANAPVTASFGITKCQYDEALDSALIRADQAMYQAKEEGKNRVCVL